MASIHATRAIEFLRICGRLKTLKRTGWVNNKVSLPESVADHMYRVSMCCMLLDAERDQVDVDRCLRMALVHDLAEAIVGDITPYDGVSVTEKFTRENEAFVGICGILGMDSPQSNEMKELWMEYENKTTKEARIVKDFDIFEMLLQANEYEIEQGVNLAQFFHTSMDKLETGTVRKWAKELQRQRGIEPVHSTGNTGINHVTSTNSS